jgi:hypothetical protein
VLARSGVKFLLKILHGGEVALLGLERRGRFGASKRRIGTQRYLYADLAVLLLTQYTITLNIIAVLFINKKLSHYYIILHPPHTLQPPHSDSLKLP